MVSTDFSFLQTYAELRAWTVLQILSCCHTAFKDLHYSIKCKSDHQNVKRKLSCRFTSTVNSGPHPNPDLQGSKVTIQKSSWGWTAWTSACVLSGGPSDLLMPSNTYSHFGLVLSRTWSLHCSSSLLHSTYNNILP